MSKTISQLFAEHIGVTEYNGIVKTIQNWYYGCFIKDSWCCTSHSYFAEQAGILDQYGGKHEGVYECYLDTKKHHNDTGVGEFWEYPNLPSEIRKDDTVFLLRNGRSHICTAYEDVAYSKNGSVQCIGGNQSDMICVKAQKMNGIQAVYRPVYEAGKPGEHITVKKGSSGEAVRELQRNLQMLGYRGYDNKIISIDGKFGGNTLYAVETFQMDWDLEVDGSCGPKTWAAIEKAADFDFYRIAATTDVNVRRGCSIEYDKITVMPMGETAIVSQEKSGWLRLMKYNGWIKGTYAKKQ